jgi:phosphatidylglycerol:prolipoprotein diacylglycerol transferase
LAVQGGVILTVILGFIYFPLVLKLPKFQVRDELGKEPVVRKVSFLVYFDVIAPSILVGQIIGRYGNYFNQEVYGQVVNDPNLINFLNHCFPWMKKEGEYLQPLFL